MIWTLFVMGFLGSLHCLGMCGPIVLALPIKNNNLTGFLQNIIYQFGRIVSYITLGIIFGIAGKGLKLSGFHLSLSIIIGVVMILFSIIPQNIVKKYSYFPIAIFLNKIKYAFKKMFEKNSFFSFFIIGVLNGLLPCGIVYIALLIALESGSYIFGGMGMLFFGLGTMPLMFFAVWFIKLISIRLRNILVKFIPIFTIIIGTLFILRGLGIRIPKLAPPKEKLQLEVIKPK